MNQKRTSNITTARLALRTRDDNNNNHTMPVIYMVTNINIKPTNNVYYHWTYTYIMHTYAYMWYPSVHTCTAIIWLIVIVMIYDLRPTAYRLYQDNRDCDGYNYVIILMRSELNRTDRKTRYASVLYCTVFADLNSNMNIKI